MNNLVIFKGVLKGVETKDISSGSTFHRIEFEVDEFYFDPVEMVKHPTSNKYYMTKFNWKDVNDFEVENEYYFIGYVHYKKVESKKAVDLEGNPFTYGTFDFRAVSIVEDKSEAKEEIIRILKLK